MAELMSDMQRRQLMNALMKRVNGGNFGLRGGRQRQQAMSPQFMAQQTPMMISATSGERRPWQKGKALEDYMMKKLRNRDNEEFYKGWKSMGSGGKQRRTDASGTSPSPSGMHDPTGTDNPRPLQDYGDWDEQNPIFPNTPGSYRDPMFDPMPQNKSRMRF